MPHDHAHGPHFAVGDEDGDRRVMLAIAVNAALTIAQVIGGLLSGSLSLIADAVHNLSDALSLVVAFVARRISRRPATDTMTFGYARAETVAALINYTTLILIAVYLGYEGVLRFFEPVAVDGWIVVIVAAVALIVDLITALLTWRMAKDSMNIRAAFLHNVADALGSVAVIVAGTLIILFGWWIVDPIATLLIAVYILWHASSEIGGVIRVLMLGAPPDIPAREVIAAIRSVDGVKDLHHLHLWQMEEARPALEAHIIIEEGRWRDAEQIKQHVRDALHSFGIEHSTLEPERSSSSNGNNQIVGHAPHGVQ